MTKREKRRKMFKVVRIASRDLGVRTGVFMRKIRSKDGDAQMAFVAAAAANGVDPTRIGEMLEMLLDFIRAVMAIFDNRK